MEITTKYFVKELNFIKNEKMRESCAKVLEKVNDEFFVAPASSTGKYHPTYALGDGGLYRHTRAAVNIAADLLSLKIFDDYNELDKDTIICALILHDTCKSGIDWNNRYTVHEHPILVEKLIRDTLDEEDNGEFAARVAPLIASHMGQWTTTRWSKVVLPEPADELQSFVHMCDYLASRKYLEYIFDDDEDLLDEDDD